MNSTLKTICSLLKQHDEPQLQEAAIRVLGAIHSREPMVHRALGELMATTTNPILVGAILDAIEDPPHDKTLEFLVGALEREDEQQERILNAIVRIGAKAVAPLRHQFERLATNGRKLVIKLLPRIRSSQAHAFLVDIFFSADHELVRTAVATLREEMRHYQTKDQADLLSRLTSSLKDKRLKDNDAALSAIIIALGIIGDTKAKTLLLPYVNTDQLIQIRRHALMSLARLDFTGERHHDVFEAVLPILKDSDWEGLVRHAVSVLIHIKPQRSDQAQIRDLLQNKHVGVKAWAISALGKIDTPQNAELILGYIAHPEMQIRDVARQALETMNSAVDVILKRLEITADRGLAFEMVRLLEHHPNSIVPEKARAMVSHMLDLRQHNDERHQLYRAALRHLSGDILRDEIIKRADEARTAEQYEIVRDLLEILDHSELMTPEATLSLIIAKLKTSRNDYHSLTFRQSDYCLEHIATLLNSDPKGFPKLFLNQKELGADEFLYVGYHFSGTRNLERRFGGDILRHVVKRWPRKDAAKHARDKLKLEDISIKVEN